MSIEEALSLASGSRQGEYAPITPKEDRKREHVHKRAWHKGVSERKAREEMREWERRIG